MFEMTHQSCLFYSSGRNKERKRGYLESRYLDPHTAERRGSFEVWPTLRLYYETYLHSLNTR